MDVAVGHDLGAGVDGGKTDEIATAGVAALATAYGVIHNQTARICGDGLRWRRRLRLQGGVTLLAPQNGKVQRLRQSLVAGRGITQTDREPVGGAQYLQDFGQSQRRFFGYGTQILEVQLSKGFQAGINWSAVTGNAQINQLAPSNSNGNFNPNGYAPTQGTVTSSGTAANIGQLAPGLLPIMNTVQPFGGVFNAVISGGKGFNAILEALGTQGKVKVLSSPRVATLNNQTAVIKVGTDNIYVTNVQTNSGTSSGAIGSTIINQATPVLSPLFSGVALDVTPSISGDGMVTLYVHPSVTSVTTQAQAFTVGSQSYNLPLASSSVREVDTVVRATSGQVIVIGGLMKTDEHDTHSGIPLLEDIPYLGYLFKSTQQTSIKSELVVLIKPIVVNKRGVWQQQIHQARADLSKNDLDFNTAVLPERSKGSGR